MNIHSTLLMMSLTYLLLTVHLKDKKNANWVTMIFHLKRFLPFIYMKSLCKACNKCTSIVIQARKHLANLKAELSNQSSSTKSSKPRQVHLWYMIDMRQNVSTRYGICLQISCTRPVLSQPYSLIFTAFSNLCFTPRKVEKMFYFFSRHGC